MIILRTFLRTAQIEGTDATIMNRTSGAQTKKLNLTLKAYLQPWKEAQNE